MIADHQGQPEDCFTGIDAAAVAGYAVARLAVRDVGRLGLTVQPDPIAGGPPGHALIPELSWDAYQSDKKNRVGVSTRFFSC